MDQLNIQIIFKEQTKYGEYCDALYFTQEQYSNMKQEDIDVLKKERVDNWIKVIETPTVEIEPTQETLESEKMAIEEQINSLQLRASEVSSKIVSIVNKALSINVENPNT